MTDNDKRKLTENERAATFIGWKLDQVCGGCDARMMDHGFSRELDENNLPVGYGHAISAPDMSDPRNYMKALEALRRRGFIWVLYANASGNHGFEIRLKEPVGFNAHHTIVDYHGGEDTAQALVEALAALYDAEHANEPA